MKRMMCSHQTINLALLTSHRRKLNQMMMRQKNNGGLDEDQDSKEVSSLRKGLAAVKMKTALKVAITVGRKELEVRISHLPLKKSRDLVEVSSPFTSPSEPPDEKIINTPSTSQYKFPIAKIDPFFPDFPTPPSSSSSRSRSVPSRKVKPVKPFKTPIRTNRSSAPSPSSTKTPSRPERNAIYPTSKPTDSTNEMINKPGTHDELKDLQNEIMISKQAIKYLREDDNARLRELIDMWKNAGRKVVEKLFGIVPEPIQSNNSTNINYHNSNHPVSSSYWNSSTSTSSMSMAIGEEQMEFIRNARRNDNGDIIDDEGNVLMIGEDEGDIDHFWNHLGTTQNYSSSDTRNRSSRYQYNYDNCELNHTKYDNEDQSSSNENQSQVEAQSIEQQWNYASLMKIFSVDPHLFGWDSVNEDWKEHDKE
ncbi:hypothetical protein V865_004815 [Kwoniella europaea PYCC6329]|uniref:Swi5-dependent recombination DNA repair protein 1 n=1 Tax=Kwoniella europaea PYCC6329 TaxID=1423913 RepID=A0AAX4KMI2_9TREE